MVSMYDWVYRLIGLRLASFAAVGLGGSHLPKELAGAALRLLPMRYPSFKVQCLTLATSLGIWLQIASCQGERDSFLHKVYINAAICQEIGHLPAMISEFMYWFQDLYKHIWVCEATRANLRACFFRACWIRRTVFCGLWWLLVAFSQVNRGIFRRASAGLAAFRS